jgi:hypothetical protein
MQEYKTINNIVWKIEGDNNNFKTYLNNEFKLLPISEKLKFFNLKYKDSIKTKINKISEKLYNNLYDNLLSYQKEYCIKVLSRYIFK